MAQAQKKAVDVLNSAAMTPMMRGLAWPVAQPAMDIESIMVIHVQVSIVEKTRPRNSCDTWLSSCEEFDTALMPTATRERPMQKSAMGKDGDRAKSA